MSTDDNAAYVDLDKQNVSFIILESVRISQRESSYALCIYRERVVPRCTFYCSRV